MVLTFCLVNSAMAGWVTSGNNMYSDVSGSVGIGTQSPAAALDIQGSWIEQLLVRNGEIPNQYLYEGVAPYLYEGVAPSGYARIGAWNGTDGVPISLVLQDAGGNVGIRRQSPAAALDIQGSWVEQLLVRNEEIPDQYLYEGVAPSGYARIGAWNGSDGVPISLVLQDAGGLVGIATQSPIAQLHLGGIYTSFQMGSSTTPTDNFHFVNEKLGDNPTFTLYNGNLASGTQLLSVVANGNIGVGTATPSQKLHVDGYVRAKGYYTGDLFFQKDGQTLWRMYEDQAGLYVENVASGKKYDVVLRESGSAQSAEGDTGVAELKQKMADLEAKLETLAKKLP